MAEPEAIAAALEDLVCPERDLAGRTLLVSAGPTQEDLDPCALHQQTVRAGGWASPWLLRRAIGART
jgi:phosphopantothenoylcysteine synthetase/decarboxylase